MRLNFFGGAGFAIELLLISIRSVGQPFFIVWFDIIFIGLLCALSGFNIKVVPGIEVNIESQCCKGFTDYYF